MSHSQSFSLNHKVTLAFSLLLFGLVVIGMRQVFAQVSTASISGIVTDPQGAVIPKATVVLRSAQTSVERSTATNNAGAYTLPNITPGEYTLEASAAGFSASRLPVFTLTVGQTAAIDFSLKVGSQSSEVTVTGAAPLLNTSSAGLGTVVATRQVNDLPLNGRNFTQLLLLTPGASPRNTGQNGNGLTLAPTTVGSSFQFPAINGQSNRSNYFLTDGLNNNGTIVNTYDVPPIIDAIQEFKVVSHTDSAEFGSVLGGVVNVVTKSGTTQFHGSAWEYFRGDSLDARPYFLPASTPKPSFNQNQFGGSVGGPVWIPKLYNGRGHKTFFFGAYQGFHYSQVEDTPLHVPTDAQLAGDESSWPKQIYNPFTTRPDPANPGSFTRDPFPGNQIPGALIDSRMIDWAKFEYPTAGPVFDSAGDNAIDPTPLTQTQNEWTVRIDQTFGNNNSAWFRYSFINSVENSSAGLPGALRTLSTPARNWGGSYTHVFSPSLVMQLQFAKTTGAYLATNTWQKSTSGIFTQVGFNPTFAGDYSFVKGGTLLPGPGIPGYSGATEIHQTYTKATDSNQYSGSITKLMGRHQLQLGAGYSTLGYEAPLGVVSLGFAAQQTADPENPASSGDPFASFLLNVPDNAVRRNVLSTERPGGVFSTYGQDSWRVTDRWTLNLGVRYDLTLIPPFGRGTLQPGEQGGIYTGDYDFSNGTYVIQKLPPPCSTTGVAPCIPGNGELPEHVVVDPRGKIAHNTYDNVGPRVGFAFQADSKTVVRGAFGILYDNWASVTQTSQNIEGQWPGIGQLQVANLNQPTTSQATPSVPAQDPFASVGGATLFPAATPFNQVSYFFDPHLKNPRSEQWNFGVERQLAASTTMTINYVGSSGSRLDVGGFYNTAVTPGPGNPQLRAPYPYAKPTNYDRSTGSSNYNALQVSLDRRYSAGLVYQVAYTWSKSMNVGGDGWYGVEGGSGGSVPQDPYDPAAFGSRSVAGNNLTNVLTVNGLYQLPFKSRRGSSVPSRIVHSIAGDWEVGGIFSAQSGSPFTPYVNGDIANTGNSGYEHADLVGNPNDIEKRTPAEWFNTGAFSIPAPFTYGTAGRNSLLSQGTFNLDASFYRAIPLVEGSQLQIRGQAFNLANHPVFGIPDSNLDDGPRFGTINSTANSPREFQLGVRLTF